MSEENVEVVERVFEAVARHDTEAVLDAYDPDIEHDFSGVRLVAFSGTPSTADTMACGDWSATATRRGRASRTTARN